MNVASRCRAARVRRHCSTSRRVRIEEQGEGGATLEDIIDGLGKIVAAGEFGALLAHVNLKLFDKRLAPLLADRPALFGALAVD
jgi:hypothetical protein